MPIITKEIEVPTPIDEAFAYVADFSTTEEWDPGIERGRRLDDGPIGEGSRFEVLAVFNDRRLPLVYEIVGFDAPRRVVLDGEGSSFRGIDAISFEPTIDGGTRIRYTADLRLKGIARLAEPFMRGRFEELGERAVRGLERVLTERSRGRAAGPT